MTGKKFITEMKTDLTLQDFAIVRNLYQPVIGNKATTLYQILFDYNNLNKIRRTYFQFADLQKTLSLSFDQIQKAKMILEAVGLLRTFEKADNNTFILIINKPLTPTAFRNNSLLYKQYISKIGEELFERFEFSNKEVINSKDDFKETTVKFQDMFDINFKEVASTLEIKIPEALNKDEAIKGLTTMQFVQFLTNKKISPALMSVVQDLMKIGFSSISVNLIVSYSFEVNGKVVAKHVHKIGNDLFVKSVTSSEEVKMELDNALESRSPKIQKSNIEQSSPQSDLE